MAKNPKTEKERSPEDSQTKSKVRNHEIEYIEINSSDLDLIQPLWEKLREHHQSGSTFFKDHFQKMTFEIRREQWREKTRGGALHAVLAQDRRTGRYIGYCVASLNAGKQGELESLYVEKDYRGAGIGDGLITRVLGWLDAKAAQKITVGVAEGNENVFSFYRRFRFYPRLTVLERKPK